MLIPTKIDNIWSFIFVSINQYANPKVINIVKNKTNINLGPRRNQYSLTLQCAKLFSLSNSICKLFKNSSNPGTFDKLNVSILILFVFYTFSNLKCRLVSIKNKKRFEVLPSIKNNWWILFYLFKRKVRIWSSTKIFWSYFWLYPTIRYMYHIHTGVHISVHKCSIFAFWATTFTTTTY